MSAIDEKTKAERALKDLQKVQGEERVLLQVLLLFLVIFRTSLQLNICLYLVLSANLDFKMVCIWQTTVVFLAAL